VTSSKDRNRFRYTFEGLELVKGSRYGVGTRCRLSAASGGFHSRGGWAGVRESVDRTSVVDGGCRCRDSRHRRPSKGTGYGLFSSAGDRLPAARASPRSLRHSARPSGPPRLFAPITEKWKKTTVKTGKLPRKLQRDHFQRRRQRETRRPPLDCLNRLLAVQFLLSLTDRKSVRLTSSQIFKEKFLSERPALCALHVCTCTTQKSSANTKIVV
jgi:hypothetical protein